MWLRKLKVAIIEKDFNAFEKLLKDVPKLSDPKEIEEAVFLTKKAATILEELKQETKESMTQIKKNIDFLNSARGDKKASFDVTF